MKKIILKNPGIEVTELCFGALPIGPIQKNVPLDTAANVIAKALERGVTFIDTAQGYKTYPHIMKAIEISGKRPVIATKSPAETYRDMEFAINEALEALKTDCIDIFLLHAARASVDVFEKRAGAYKCLLDYKEKGKIKATGISTHSVAVTNKAAQIKELDIVFPILNILGMGILEGTRDDMEAAVENCFSAGKDVYFMKALAGGNILNNYAGAMKYIREFSKGRAPVAVGMVNTEEVDINIDYFSGKTLSEDQIKYKPQEKEFIVLNNLCKACGKCVKACHSSAVSIKNKIASMDKEKCLKCGYCVGACPEFAIRMV